ncbi:MAG: hypothetical protein AAFN04_06800 [Pseudomonadota bacterium]
MPSSEQGKAIAVVGEIEPSFRVKLALVGVTLLYLIIEAGFNARLIDVLGATEGELASPKAISGLEFWGRMISSLAVGLALGTAHVAQMHRFRAPFPVNLLKRENERWTSKHFVQSVAIVVLAMIATFYVERALVDDGAERQDPVTLWWAHFGAMATDFAGITLNQALSDEEQAAAFEESLTEVYDDEDAKVGALGLDDLDRADAKTFIALMPYSVQNFARVESSIGEDGEALSAREIQEDVNEGFIDAIVGAAAAQSRPAILKPIERCFGQMYSQDSPLAVESDEVSSVDENCLSRNPTLDSFASDLPDFLTPSVSRCFAKMGPNGATYADYKSINCLYDETEKAASRRADTIAKIYESAYSSARRSAINRAKARPIILPRSWRGTLGRNLRVRIDRFTDRAFTRAQRQRIFNPATETVPPCRSLGNLVNRFPANYRNAKNRRWLERQQNSFCQEFERILPEEPASWASRTFSWLVPRFGSDLEKRVANETSYELQSFSGLRSVEGFKASQIRQVSDPVKTRLNSVLSDQFADLELPRSQAPKIGQYNSLDEFFGNAGVSSLARTNLKELSESALQCVGIAETSGLVEFRGSLSNISANWDRQFQNKALSELKSNGFATRFSGVISDFDRGARCRMAGVSSYHRATMPGTALLLSMLGLLYHACKLVFYLAGLFSLSRLPRLGLTAIALIGMLAAPLSVSSKILDQPLVERVIDTFEQRHSSGFAFGVRWLIRAELALYPISSAIYQTAFAPIGLDFQGRSELEIASQSPQDFAQSCSAVPEIAQSPEYESLDALLSSRTFCEQD